MTDYTELVKALRICSSELNCGDCPLLYRDSCSSDELMNDAAAAIEDMAKHITEMHERVTVLQIARGKLEAEVERLQADVEAAYALMEVQDADT